MDDTMLKRIRITGYRSICDASIDLDNINILIGPNGGGKSNFLSALELIQKIVSQELLVRLDALSQELTILEQCICRDWSRYILRSIFVGDMDHFERDVMFLRNLLYLRHPIASERTLIRVVENETSLIYMRVFGAILELWRRNAFLDQQIHEIDTTVRYIRDLKSLVRQELGIS